MPVRHLGEYLTVSVTNVGRIPVTVLWLGVRFTQAFDFRTRWIFPLRPLFTRRETHFWVGRRGQVHT
jgi:hypothetical protein